MLTYSFFRSLTLFLSFLALSDSVRNVLDQSIGSTFRTLDFSDSISCGAASSSSAVTLTTSSPDPSTSTLPAHGNAHLRDVVITVAGLADTDDDAIMMPHMAIAVRSQRLNINSQLKQNAK